MERNYTLIFAGQHGVGKTHIFSCLKRQLPITEEEVLSSVSSNGNQFVTTVQSHGVVAKVSIWDTAGMELNGSLGMTRSYFKDCHGIILVANRNVESSLHILSDWITAAQNYCNHVNRLVISLWAVDYDSENMPLVQDFLREWQIPDNLMVRISIVNGNGIMDGFKTVADAMIAINESPPSLRDSMYSPPNIPAGKNSDCCS